MPIVSFIIGNTHYTEISCPVQMRVPAHFYQLDTILNSDSYYFPSSSLYLLRLDSKVVI